MNNARRHIRGTAVFLLLVVILLLTGGCDRQEPEHSGDNASGQDVATASKGTIVALGDSLTAGLGVDEEESYPAQLERRLRAEGYNYRVINAGVSGETTSGTLSRLDWILSMKPDIVILEIGANDGLRGIDPAVPAKNLREILRILRANGVVVVFTGMQMVWNLGPAYTRDFNGIYPQIAGEEKVIFMPFFLEGVATVRELNIEDGLHPNGRGYARVVKNIYPYVREAIEQFEQNKGSR